MRSSTCTRIPASLPCRLDSRPCHRYRSRWSMSPRIVRIWIWNSASVLPRATTRNRFRTSFPRAAASRCMMWVSIRHRSSMAHAVTVSCAGVSM